MSDERSVKIKQLLFYIVEQNIYVLCLKQYAPKMITFRISILTPTLTRKIENNRKTNTDGHNYNVSSIQAHFIWFSSFNTFQSF